MDIHVNHDSEVPLHEQISAQVVFLIGTGRLTPGTFLPSVRALAQRLGVHRNTIGRAYHDLTLKLLVEMHPGRRLAVRASAPATVPGARDLDDLIGAVLIETRRRGYSLQQLHDRLRERLLAAPPDHLLVLSDDAGMRLLLPKELSGRFACRVDACSPAELLLQPERGVGALVVSPPGHIPGIRSVLSPERPAIAIAYSPADEHLAVIRRLTKPSFVAVVSVSRYFLQMARRLLAPVVGRRHSMRGYLMAGTRPGRPGAADFVFCDVITYPVVRPRYKAGTVVVHKLISESCIQAISSVIESRGPEQR
jgi:DNA-binding transcriptional regulator YhcF (GntR family)